MKRMTITFNEYVEVLKVIASNHAIGKLFTEFNDVNLNEKIYLLISAGFYIFSIYQNVMTCIKFNKNMIKIHSHIKKIKEYIEYSICKMNNLLLYTDPLKTYNIFNEQIKEKITELTKMKEELEKVTEYKFTMRKISELGIILKSFYTLYNNIELNANILYTFGINGYIDNLEGLVSNVNTKKMNYVTFEKKKSKSKMKNLYYPVNENPVKNSVKMKKNLIITGPNASGKTTVLKSSLINIFMTQQMGCGFYKSAKMNPYKYIHCYLNIPDTSGRDSLFQAEARRCKDILVSIVENPVNHCCIFDEIYSGTNPTDAVSCATMYLEEMNKYKVNVDYVLTTHYIELCELFDKKISNLKMNVNVLDDKIEYLYKIENGISYVHGGKQVLKDLKYPLILNEK
jgi:DNA mismatch repair ATPase MutS